MINLLSAPIASEPAGMHTHTMTLKRLEVSFGGSLFILFNNSLGKYSSNNDEHV